MKKVSKEVLKDAANRLMFDMSDEQYNILLEEFDVITKQLELMGNIEGIDKEGVMTFPFNCEVDYLREDEPAKALTQEEVLQNAGSIKDGQVKLPKVIG